VSKKNYAIAIKLKPGYGKWYERAALWMTGEWRWLGNAKRFTKSEAKHTATKIEARARERPGWSPRTSTWSRDLRGVSMPSPVQ